MTATPDLSTLTGDYTVDPAHTTIGFTARHAMVTNVKGKFLDFTGTLHLDGSDPSAFHGGPWTSRWTASSTGSADRDGHLKSSDFFSTGEYPTMTSAATKAESLGGDDYRITGDLSSPSASRPPHRTWRSAGAAVVRGQAASVRCEAQAEARRSEWGPPGTGLGGRRAAASDADASPSRRSGGLTPQSPPPPKPPPPPKSPPPNPPPKSPGSKSPPETSPPS
ncbi:Protein YceI [Streptomyces tendae]